MLSALERIRASFDSRCLVNRIDKNDCSVRLFGCQNAGVIVDMDCEWAPLDCDETHCDYLIFFGDSETVVFVPLELKKSWRDKAVLQLQACSSVAEQHVPSNCAIELRPVVACKNFSPRGMRKKLRQFTVVFRGQEEPIQIIKCGRALPNVIERPALATYRPLLF